ENQLQRWNVSRRDSRQGTMSAKPASANEIFQPTRLQCGPKQFQIRIVTCTKSALMATNQRARGTKHNRPSITSVMAIAQPAATPNAGVSQEYWEPGKNLAMSLGMPAERTPAMPSGLMKSMISLWKPAQNQREIKFIRPRNCALTPGSVPSIK